jgi:hypothetical protein
VLGRFSFIEPVLIEQSVYQSDEDASVNEPKKLFSTAKAVIKYPFSLKVEMNSTVTIKENIGGDEYDVIEETYNNRVEYIVKDDDVVEIYNGTIVSFSKNKALAFYELFSFDNIDDFLHYLDLIKVDSAKVTLGLYDHRICYVIGSENAGDNNNQLWIEKDSYLPKMLVMFYNGGDMGHSAKHIFSKYDLNKKTFFPINVKYYKNDKLDLEFLTTRIGRTGIEDDEIFNVKKIMRGHKVEITPQSLTPENIPSEQ